MDKILEINNKLKECGKRIIVNKFVGTASWNHDIEFYEILSNKSYLKRNIIVFWEMGEIKSILEQRIAGKRYCYQINGQSSTNTQQIYFKNW